MVVAIDGPAGSGKSVVAKLIAEKHHYFLLNSGYFYRAVTFESMRQSINLQDRVAVCRLAEQGKIELTSTAFFFDSVNITDYLHRDDVSERVALVSSNSALRMVLNKKMRDMSDGKDLVCEGRDMSSIVFPFAEVKIYLDASATVRAQRRFKQGVSHLTLAEIEENIRNRDIIDQNKAVGALIIAKNAQYIDSSNLTLDEVCEKIDQMIDRAKQQEHKMAEKEALILSQLEKEINKSFGQAEEGALVEGTIVQLDSEYVYLDVGLKSEGKILLAEFKVKPLIGDKVSCVLQSKEGRHGEIIVSKKKADHLILMKNFTKCFEAKTPIEGKIVKSVKGGFDVDLGSGLMAFLPISKADVTRVEEPEEYIGLEGLFIIDRLSDSRGKSNIVVTRRDYLALENDKNRDIFFNTAKVGDTVEGIVKSFTSFGAFIDLGGFDGLLHLNDMSWGHATRPKDYVKKDDKITLKVARLDPENKRINLSIKHFADDPWVGFPERYKIDDIVKGKVTKLTDFGVFIEIEDGIEGLVHISELSWVKRIKHPKEILSIGDEVSVAILGYDTESERISLGLKQTLENPWNSIIAKYPIGTKLTRKVKKITNAGAFIELEDGVDGFLHSDDMSWSKKGRGASLVKHDEEIEVVVIDVIPEEHRIRLGVKQLSEDPWIALEAAYYRGEVQVGEVTGKTDFGVFVRLPSGIEGLIHRNNLSEDKDADTDALLRGINIGDEVTATIVEISPEKKRLALSIRDMKMKEQRQEMHKYMTNSESIDNGSTLADFVIKN